MKARFILTVLLFLFPAALISQEDITITTYYPSPFGSYSELRAQRMAIGNTYFDGAQYCWGAGCPNIIDASADLAVEGNVVVEGNVGIGTMTPSAQLNVHSAIGQGRIDISGLSDAGHTYSAFYLHDNTPETIANSWVIAHKNENGTSLQDAFTIGKYGGLGLYNPYMMISRQGNVGIGTEDPQANLDMGTGGIRLQGTDAAGQTRFHWPTGSSVGVTPAGNLTNTWWTNIPGLSRTVSARAGDVFLVMWSVVMVKKDNTGQGGLLTSCRVTNPDTSVISGAYPTGASTPNFNVLINMSNSGIYTAPMDGNYTFQIQYQCWTSGPAVSFSSDATYTSSISVLRL
ncbi:MAG: hypothetical protein AB1481_00235 [Candidatus Omnitrophota bacterium]